MKCTFAIFIVLILTSLLFYRPDFRFFSSQLVTGPSRTKMEIVINVLLPGFSWGVMDNCLFTPDTAVAAGQKKLSTKV